MIIKAKCIAFKLNPEPNVLQIMDITPIKLEPGDRFDFLYHPYSIRTGSRQIYETTASTNITVGTKISQIRELTNRRLEYR